MIGGGHELEVDICDFQDDLESFSIRHPFFKAAEDLGKTKDSIPATLNTTDCSLADRVLHRARA